VQYLNSVVAWVCALAIVQVLWRELLDTVQSQLPSKVVKSLKSPSQAINFKVEVNSFFRWAISEVHSALLKELEDDFKDNS
jgi:hypothetical protein